ncbi:MAG: helix-turn-helix transcriptional regulator [Bacteroidales bacterium]|jgi:transcriptional regulator with XRE-family HTH domain|nr:helix-turn-helix transcriptional regulator [Bacteroidales bacterium]MBQ6083085.1 helix-turn-helix transcriptional regulator [Bacteroidales bacterium]
MKSVIGKNLKSLRVANGYNQENVAEFMGINRSTYSNYESGDREAPLDVLEKAALLFGCDLSLFFEEDQNALKGMLACAFRADNLNIDDMKEVADFKNIVLNYMKMERLLEE